MIKLVSRSELNEDKYNACVESSQQSLIYAYSWYLDIVCDQWNVLVLDDYDVVMPVPYRRKYLIPYVHPPLWVLQLGLFSKKKFHQSDFISTLEKKFRFIELRLNSENTLEKESSLFVEKQFQELDLTQEYEAIENAYQSDRKKDLKRANKHQLKIEWGSGAKELIRLFQNNVGKRTPEIKEQDYSNLEKLIKTCVDRDVGEICSVYQEEQLVASAFFLKHQETVTILCSSTDFSNRKNGANTFLIDQAIQRYSSDYKTFNFGGSSMESIAKYFFSFGAVERIYPMLIKKPKLL